MKVGAASRSFATEREFQDAVAHYAQLFGWAVVHFRPARTKNSWRTAGSYDSKGFPDLLLARDRLIAAELKSTAGRVTVDQEAWLGRFRQCGIAAFVWRPSDWFEIEDVLRRPPTQLTLPDNSLEQKGSE